MPGQSGTLFFSFAATQVPVKISTFTLTLASSTQDEVEPDAPADEPVVEPEPEIPADDTVVEPEIPVDDNVEGDAPLLSISALNPNSWYQRVTLTVTSR